MLPPKQLVYIRVAEIDPIMTNNVLIIINNK
jgi:hypothetical protein